MSKTYGQLAEGIKDYKDFESKVAHRLKHYPFIKTGGKASKLCKKLYRQGYTVADTVSFIILNA